MPHFLVAPSIVAETDLVLTTGRRIAEQLAAPLGLAMLPPPIKLAPFIVRMVWHPRSEDESVGKWLRSAGARRRGGAAGAVARSQSVTPSVSLTSRSSRGLQLREQFGQRNDGDADAPSEKP